MGTYDNLLKDQLRELCLQRELPVSGTNAELIARLEGWDDAHSGDEPDLLVEAGIEPPSEQPPPLPPAPEPIPPKVIPNVREDPPGPEEVPANQTVHRVRFEVPGSHQAVIPTELHQQFIRATENVAIQAGHRIRGGASRIGFDFEGGKRYAIYEVTLGRRIREAR